MYATKGDNLIAVGWRGGILQCAFASKDGARIAQFSGVPEDEYEKLKRSPFPYHLFTTNIKGKFPYTKVG